MKRLIGDAAWRIALASMKVTVALIGLADRIKPHVVVFEEVDDQ